MAEDARCWSEPGNAQGGAPIGSRTRARCARAPRRASVRCLLRALLLGLSCALARTCLLPGTPAHVATARHAETRGRAAQVVAAFRSAVHFGDDESEADEMCPYTFINGHVFNALMQFCLQVRPEGWRKSEPTEARRTGVGTAPLEMRRGHV